MLNRTGLPGDVIAFVMFRRRHVRLTLRELSEILALRGRGQSQDRLRLGSSAAPIYMRRPNYARDHAERMTRQASMKNIRNAGASADRTVLIMLLTTRAGVP